MRILWSVLVWLAFITITVVCAVLVLLSVALLWPFDRNLRVGQFFATVWAHGCFKANPRWSLEVRGRERFRAAGTAVLCANHTSQVDILSVSALHGQWRWVSKREMFFFPFLGWAMWAIGTPSVKRGDKESGQKMLAHCRRWLDRGVSILIFPEGTRSPTGDLQAFKPGAFKLALESGRPVLPIVVFGADQALPKKGADLSRRAHVIVSVLAAIDTAPFKESFDVEGLSSHVRAKMADELYKLRDERAKTSVASS
jgi:1-acyl-sn-glycerol-3-phosphate acyltransferase